MHAERKGTTVNLQLPISALINIDRLLRFIESCYFYFSIILNVLVEDESKGLKINQVVDTYIKTYRDFSQ